MSRHSALALIAVFSWAAVAQAGASDPVTLNAPREGATYRLGEPLRGIGPAPYRNAKKYDCTVKQGAVTWHRESPTPGFEMSVADVDKFKPGPSVITARVFFHNAWLPAAKATFTFAPSKAAKPADGNTHYNKAVVAAAIADARDKWKTICGCDVPMSVDDSTFTARGPQGGNATSKVKGTFEIVALCPTADICKDDAAKAKMCANLRGVVVAEEHGGMGGQCESDDKHVVTCTVGQGYGGDVLRGMGMMRDGSGYHW